MSLSYVGFIGKNPLTKSVHQFGGHVDNDTSYYVSYFSGMGQKRTFLYCLQGHLNSSYHCHYHVVMTL